MKPIEPSSELTSLCKGIFDVNDILKGFNLPKGFYNLQDVPEFYTPKDGDVFAVLENNKVVGLVKAETQTVSLTSCETSKDLLVSISSDGNLSSNFYPNSLIRITDDVFRETRLSFEPKVETFYIRIDPICWDKMLNIRKMFLASLESLFGKICKENEELVNKSTTYPL